MISFTIRTKTLGYNKCTQEEADKLVAKIYELLDNLHYFDQIEVEASSHKYNFSRDFNDEQVESKKCGETENYKKEWELFLQRFSNNKNQEEL